MSSIGRLDRKHDFTCSTHPRINIETSIFYGNSFRPEKLLKIDFVSHTLWRLIYDDTIDEIWSNFYSFREYVHSPLTDSHFRGPIPRRRKIDFEVRRREDANMTSPNTCRVFSLFMVQVIILLGILLCVDIEFCIRDPKYF